MVTKDLAEGARDGSGRCASSPWRRLDTGRQQRVLFSPARPGFMNDSGRNYASLAKKQGMEPSRLIAVHDELDIPAGTIR